MLQEPLLSYGRGDRFKWLALTPSLTMFSAFACLFALQHSLKQRLGVPDDDSQISFAFSYGVSALYWGQVTLRFGHAWVLKALTEVARTQLALGTMAVVMFALRQLSCEGGGSVSSKVVWVGICYLGGGAALGVFEGNYVQLLGEKHPEAKLHGISGIPLGIFLVVVVGFGLMGLEVVEDRTLYVAAGAGCGVGAVVMSRLSENAVEQSYEEEEVWSPVVESAMRSSPRPPRRAMQAGTRQVSMNAVIICSIVYMLNMSIVSGWSPGVLLYVYNSEYIEIKYLGFVSTSLFFAIFSCFGCVADLVSRKLVYLWRLESPPVYFLLLTVSGVWVLASRVPGIAPLGTMLVFLGNGSIYACSCRLIDDLREPECVTYANSVFFAAGDVGSILGASLIPHLRYFLFPAVVTGL